MSIELLNSFKTQAILDVFNHLTPDAQLKSWDKSKATLVARIFANNTSDAIEAAIKATEDGPKPGTKGKVVKTAKAKKAAKPAKKTAKTKTTSDKPKGKGVGAAIRELILANPVAPALDILTSFQKKFPEAKTTVGCVGWYRSQMYKTGELGK